MPCRDITDSLTIHLDNDDRIIRYELRKKTCGEEVGNSELIGRWLYGQTADQLLETTIPTLLVGYPTQSAAHEYLVIKHLLAVQAAVSALLGRQPGGVEDYCTIASIEHGPDGIALKADINVKGMTEEIEACRGYCLMRSKRGCTKNEPNSSIL